MHLEFEVRNSETALIVSLKLHLIALQGYCALLGCDQDQFEYPTLFLSSNLLLRVRFAITLKNIFFRAKLVGLPLTEAAVDFYIEFLSVKLCCIVFWMFHN